jgi:hypothetical protein
LTVTTSVNKVIWQGNGATTVFSYSFPIPTTASVIVFYTDASGNQTILSPAQYTITGIGSSSGGTLTYPISGGPIAAGTTLTLERLVPYTQPESLANQGGLWPTAIEQGGLDNLEYQIQQLAEQTARAILLNPADAGPVAPLVPAALRAGLALMFNSLGQPIAAGFAPPSIPISAAMQAFVAAISITAALQILGVRLPISGNTTWFVDGTNGNDSNNGLTPGTGAFKTIQHALIAVQGYDGNGFAGAISVAAGTYNEGAGLSVANPFFGFSSVSLIAAGSVIVNATGNAGAAGSVLSVSNCAVLIVSGPVTLNPTGTGSNVIGAIYGGQIFVGAGVTLGSNANATHMYATRFGYMEVQGNVFIQGGTTANVVQASHSGNWRHGTPGVNVTFNGNLTVTDATLYALFGDITVTSTSNFNLNGFTVTGQKLRAAEDGIIQWALGNYTSVPGSIIGGENLNGRVSFGVNSPQRWSNLITYDMSLPSGTTVVVTGLGFTPGVVHFNAAVSAGATSQSDGFAMMLYDGTEVNIAENLSMSGGPSGIAIIPFNNACIAYRLDASDYVLGAVIAVSTDGFTLQFNKSGTPSGTLSIIYLAERGN